MLFEDGLAETPRVRVAPDPTRSPVRIAGRLMNELCNHALESQPEECCGLVTGNDRNRFERVHRCRNEMTARHRDDPATHPRTGTEAFLMNEADYLRAQQEAEAVGDRVTAVYHSHVGAGVYFSELDQAFVDSPFFPFPQASHIVLSVWDHRVSGAGIFERDGVSGAFVGGLIEVGDE